MLNKITRNLIMGNIQASIKAAEAAVRQSTDAIEIELLKGAINSLTQAYNKIASIKPA